MAGSPTARAALLAALLVASLGASGCKLPPRAVSRPDVADRLRGAQVLVMPPELEYYEMTNAGLVPHAAWTEAARRHLAQGLEEYFEGSGRRILGYTASEDPTRAQLHDQLLKLYCAVARTIGHHELTDFTQRLATKEGLDWTLGPAISDLHHVSGADFGLFIYVRGSAPSVTHELTAAAFNTQITGEEVAEIALVDLRDGDVVWFSQEVVQIRSPMQQAVLKALPESWDVLGDLRQPQHARKRIEYLLRGLPE